MINVAHILPVNQISPDMPRQSYEMYLTAKVLEYPEKFTFLAADDNEVEPPFKILDNSACELGCGLQMNKVMEAAEIINANEIVLSDIPQSSKSFHKTLEALMTVVEWADKRNVQIAAVCQGETIDQIKRCIDQILSLEVVDTIMIPKWYCNLTSDGLGRHQLVKYVREAERRKGVDRTSIHLLGLDGGIYELIGLGNEVRSVDTGLFSAYSTPTWSSLNIFSERPRELKINLDGMNVDMNRWEKLISQVERVLLEDNQSNV